MCCQWKKTLWGKSNGRYYAERSPKPDFLKTEKISKNEWLRMIDHQRSFYSVDWKVWFCRINVTFCRINVKISSVILQNEINSTCHSAEWEKSNMSFCRMTKIQRFILVNGIEFWNLLTFFFVSRLFILQNGFPMRYSILQNQYSADWS